MLPGIDPQKRHVLPHDGILIRIRLHLHFARLLVLDEPRPSAPLDPRQLRVHHLLESVERSVTRVDSPLQRSRGLAAPTGPLGSQILPEERMVDMSAAVEVDEGLEGDGFRGGAGGVEFFGGGVVGVDVGLVVVLVVQFHDLAGDGGFEGTVIV